MILTWLSVLSCALAVGMNLRAMYLDRRRQLKTADLRMMLALVEQIVAAVNDPLWTWRDAMPMARSVVLGQVSIDSLERLLADVRRLEQTGSRLGRAAYFEAGFAEHCPCLVCRHQSRLAKTSPIVVHDPQLLAKCEITPQQWYQLLQAGGRRE